MTQVAKIKAVYTELGLYAQFEKFEEDSYQDLKALIDKVPHTAS